MKIIRILEIIFILFLSQNNFAQKRIIKGTVTDSLQHPLEYANIMAESKDKKLAPVFSLTDQNGKFELSLLRKKPYIVSVAYMGYKTAIFTIDPLTNNIPKHIVLKPKKEILDEVTIISEVSVKVYNDSVVYNTKKFTDGSERKLKDIIKKLPGIELDKKGSITVMGKKVSKIMVDGKDFFGGGTKLALNHIPADAVDGIVAIKDYHNVGFMRGLTDRQKMVINVKLNEGKKKFLFGDLLAGKGNNSYYEAKTNLFYFSPKTNFTFLGNSNNTGKNILTFEDFRHFEQSDMMDFEQMKSTFKSYNILSQFILSDHFTNKKQHFGALQWQQDFGSKITFNTFGIVTKRMAQEHDQGVFQFFNDGHVFREQTNTHQFNENVYVLGKINFAYKPDYFHRINYNMFIKKNIFSGRQEILSKYNDNNNSRYINKDITNNTGSITQELLFHYKINKHHVIRFLSQDILSSETPEFNWQTNQNVFNELIPDLNHPINNIIQTTPKNAHRLNMAFTHYWLINNKNHIYTSVGYAYYKHYLATNTFEKNNNTSQNIFTSVNFNNNLNLTLKDIFTGFKYKFKWKGKIFKPGIFLHKYLWNINEKHLDTLNTQRLLWLPELRIEWPTTNLKSIELDYKLKADFPAPHKFLPRFYIVSYNNLESGNINLKNELYHDISIKWSGYNMSKKRNISIRFQYKQKIYGLYNTVVLNQGNTYLKPVIVNLPDKYLSGVFYYKKGYKYWSFRFSPIFYFHQYSQQINQKWEHIKSLNHYYNLNIITKFKKYPNINLGLSGDFSNNKQNSRDVNYTTYKYQMEISYGLQYIFGKLNWLQEQVTNSQTSTYSNLDFNLRYKNDTSPFGFELSLINILNESRKISYIFNNYYSANQIIFQQGFRAMFKISYSL